MSARRDRWRRWQGVAQPPAEAHRGVGRLVEDPPRGGADARAVPARRLEEDGAGVGDHAGVVAADDAGDRDDPGAGADHEVALDEGMVAAAEVDDPLTRLGAADHDLGAAAAADPGAHEAVEVEGVERLPDLEHHEVGHVDDVVDRGEARGEEPPLHPPRRRGDSDVLDHPGHETGASLRVLDPDAHPVLDRGHRGERLRHPGARLVEGLGERRGELAGEPDVAEAVGAVGGDLDLEHGVEVEHLGRRLTGPSALEEEQSVGVVAETELDRRAEEARELQAEHHLLPAPAGSSRGAGSPAAPRRRARRRARSAPRSSARPASRHRRR